MREIILNEKTTAEECMNNRSLGAKPSDTLFRIAKYYNQYGYNKSEIGERLRDFLLRCSPETNLSNWRDIIEYASNNASKYKLIEIDYIPVTQIEINKIKQLDGELLQRLMFTLLCLAKYGNAISDKNNNWVNREHNEIFSLANIKISDIRKAGMINNLCKCGYVTLSKIVDNININVSFIDNDSTAAFKITDFRNLGNQFRKICGDDYIYCKECGLTIKKTCNATKYCKECAAKVKNSYNVNKRKQKIENAKNPV